MKLSMLVLVTALLGSNAALANDKCRAEAELQARIFSANENNVTVKSVKVKDSFFVEAAQGVLYYGVLLNNRENVNVGVREKDCSLAYEPNYVTDGL